MSILITLILWLIVVGLIYWLVSLIPLPHPFPAVIQVCFILLAVLAALSAFGVIGSGLPFPHV